MGRLVINSNENYYLYYDIMSTSRSHDNKVWVDYYRIRPDTDYKNLEKINNIIENNHDFIG